MAIAIKLYFSKAVRFRIGKHLVRRKKKKSVKEKKTVRGEEEEEEEEVGLSLVQQKAPGSFLGNEAAMRAKKHKEEAVKLAAKVKALVPVQLSEKQLVVNDNLLARVLKTCKAGGFVVPPLVEQQQSTKRGRKRLTERPLIQPGKKMLEVSKVLSPEVADLNLSLPQELGRLLVTPLKKKGGRRKGSLNKPKNDPPCPVLKGRKSLLKLIEEDDMLEEVIPSTVSSFAAPEAMEVVGKEVVVPSKKKLSTEVAAMEQENKVVEVEHSISSIIPA
ncbi:hypothetical protein ACLB2K_023522 [Fragaria x ananassa]